MPSQRQRTSLILPGGHPTALRLQELLSHCLDLHKDSQRRIIELESRLRQYGLKAEYQGPIIDDLDELVSVADAHADIACTKVRPAACDHCIALQHLCWTAPLLVADNGQTVPKM